MISTFVDGVAGLDVIFGGESLQGELTGIGNYATALLRGLRAEPRIRSVRCFANQRWLDDLPVPADPPPPGLPSRIARTAIRLVPAMAPALRLVRDRYYGSMLNRTGASLYHEPNFILRPFDGPSLATIHDLSVLRFPEFHPADRVAYITRNLAETLRRASRLITVSELVRTELIAEFGLAANRVVAIPNGVGPEYRPCEPAEIQPILDGYGLVTGRYLLAVGTLEPRKNIAALLDAYEGLPAGLSARFPLVVAGGRGWRNEALTERLDRLARSGVVHRLGYVPADDLPMLYAGARGVGFVSLYEGFGLPALEAAVSGVPVLTSRDSAMAEILGERALLVEPRDVGAIRDGLRRLLDDEPLQTGARAAAAAFGARFSWARCVERTVAAYEAVV
jgi:glycosyltransferase involved in cell wall biosynthesis